MAKNEFAEHMKTLENFQLMEIVTTNRTDYTPEGLQAAEDELRTRNLQPEELEEGNEVLRKKEESENEPLTFSERVHFLLFSWRPGTWASARLLEYERKPQKSREAFAILRRGLLSWIIFILILVLYNVLAN